MTHRCQCATCIRERRAFRFAVLRGALGGLSVLILVLACLFLAGCGYLPGRPSIKSGDTTVTGPKNPGTPTVVNTTQSGTTVPLPAGSTVTVTTTAAVPATNETPAQPAKEVTTIQPAGPTEYHKAETAVQASSGTVDTSVAKHQIDAEERRWLLWAAIGCGIAGLFLKQLMPAWPGLSNGLLIAAPCAFAAWKFAEVPGWLWAVVIAGVGLLALGYKRAEWDKNHDGIPDALQKK